MVSTIKRITIATILALAMMTVAVPPATAHDHASFGAYSTSIGWATEPPLVDQANQVTIRIEGANVLDSHLFSPGESFTWRFGEAGEHNYHCHPHPWMKGSITVLAADGHDAHGHGAATTHTVKVLDGATEGEYRYDPAHLEVHVGDTVVWVNEGTMAHTVTAMVGDHASQHDSGMEHGDEAMGMDGNHSMEGGHEHDAMAKGTATKEESGHGHGKQYPIVGLQDSFSAKITIGGKEKVLKFRQKWGEPGMYVADIIPTVAGVYNLHFTGALWNEAFDYKVAIQEVKASSTVQFPEQTKSNFELQKELNGYKEELKTLQGKVQTSAGDVKDTEGGADNATPFPAALALVAVAAAGVILHRMRRD